MMDMFDNFGNAMNVIAASQKDKSQWVELLVTDGILSYRDIGNDEIEVSLYSKSDNFPYWTGKITLRQYKKIIVDSPDMTLDEYVNAFNVES